MQLTQPQIQHLYLRTGFGESPGYIAERVGKFREQLAEELFANSQELNFIEIIPNPLGENNEGEVTNIKLLKMLVRSQKELRSLGLHWINQMAYGKGQLRERMTFFWHNHFATRLPFGFIMQLQHNTLRKHALGKFPDMLHAIAKDPAMMMFLNTFENKKDAPNENFAREVMELFTLGEGHYTEAAIKEAARCFTGWKVNRKGEFEIIAKEHDNGEKDFFGKKGNLNGEDIINIILEQKQTAYFLCRKIYKEFVNPKVNEVHIKELAEPFFYSGYDISMLIRQMILSPWFFDTENIGVKISSPVDLLARYTRVFRIKFEDEKLPAKIMQLLGQELFVPPNVAGWSGDKNWIDSSSLLLRMRLPLVLFAQQPLNAKSKTSFEDNATDSHLKKQRTGSIKVNYDLSALSNYFLRYTGNEKELIQELKRYFLQQPTSVSNEAITLNADRTSSANFIKSCMTSILCLPEFQLI
ncbi:MAG: DUF1800 domain-containing protein [Bacteroidia bacterium]|nr:DUF1800 domain-containing protein [Bacteroidia bacterium]